MPVMMKRRTTRSLISIISSALTRASGKRPRFRRSIAFTVETGFDSVIPVEDDVLGIQIEVCIPAARFCKTYESLFDSFYV